VIDASVTAVAAQHRADIVTGDAEDIRRLVAAARLKVATIDV